MWASPALAGAVHDVRAAREHGIIEALAEPRIRCWADNGYQGAGGTVRLPYRGRRDSLSTGQQAVNRSHAKIRALVKQAIATLTPGASSANSADPSTRLPSSRPADERRRCNPHRRTPGQGPWVSVSPGPFFSVSSCHMKVRTSLSRVDLDPGPPGTDRVCQTIPTDAPSARITLDHRQERHSQGLPDASVTQRRSTGA
jgi:hypothetical protein